MQFVFWFLVAVGVLYVCAMVLGAILTALGEAAATTTSSVEKVSFQMGRAWARRVGRADQEGDEVERFVPAVTASLPKAYSSSELEQCRQELRSQIAVERVPEIVVPDFPSPPDVLQRPTIVSSTTSTTELNEVHIPTLLNGRSTDSSIPARLDLYVSSTDLVVPEWKPTTAFPKRPEPFVPAAVQSKPIVLALPLYAEDEGFSWFRKLIVRRLNRFVRAVHHQRVHSFELQKAEAQKERDALAVSNQKERLAAQCALAVWEQEKATTEATRHALRGQYEELVNSCRERYRERRERYLATHQSASKRLEEFWADVMARSPEAVCRLFDIALARIAAPRVFPRDWVLEYDADQGILIVDLRLPDFDRIEITRHVVLKRETKTKPVRAKEQKELAERASCLYVLRVLHELVQHDQHSALKAIALNGWVEYVDATTGRDRSVVILSIFSEIAKLKEIDIARVDPAKCIASLGGRFAGIEHGYVAIAPIVRLNRHDDRLIEGSDVLSELATGTNLAAMDWDKFEHLIRQVFEKVFSGPEIEVKVTRASRDRGVDAIIFDPDPIRGGKTVIQAKRYINTVDLSAVRDLYGTVVNEGANKGILVTTSSFGPDAYEFAKDKNLTLLTGRELLGLLEKHGYRYRIDLEEARRLQAAQG